MNPLLSRKIGITNSTNFNVRKSFLNLTHSYCSVKQYSHYKGNSDNYWIRIYYHMIKRLEICFLSYYIGLRMLPKFFSKRKNKWYNLQKLYHRYLLAEPPSRKAASQLYLQFVEHTLCTCSPYITLCPSVPISGFRFFHCVHYIL